MDDCQLLTASETSISNRQIMNDIVWFFTHTGLLSPPVNKLGCPVQVSAVANNRSHIFPVVVTTEVLCIVKSPIMRQLYFNMLVMLRNPT